MNLFFLYLTGLLIVIVALLGAFFDAATAVPASIATTSSRAAATARGQRRFDMRFLSAPPLRRTTRGRLQPHTRPGLRREHTFAETWTSRFPRPPGASVPACSAYSAATGLGT